MPFFLSRNKVIKCKTIEPALIFFSPISETGTTTRLPPTTWVPDVTGGRVVWKERMTGDPNRPSGPTSSPPSRTRTGQRPLKSTRTPSPTQGTLSSMASFPQQTTRSSFSPGTRRGGQTLATSSDLAQDREVRDSLGFFSRFFWAKVSKVFWYFGEFLDIFPKWNKTTFGCPVFACRPLPI